MPGREFEIGDPGLPTAGVLVGRGGGTTLRYLDFTADTDGLVTLLEYDTLSGRIPDDYLSIAIAMTVPEEIRHLMSELDKVGFWNIKPVGIQSSMTRYLAMIDEKRGIHYLVWGDEDEPFPKEFHGVYESLKNRMIDLFINLVK